MNIYEILVIAAAAVAFVIINIIMWTIIIKIERKEKQKEAFEAVYGTDSVTATADTSSAGNKDETSFDQPSIFFDYTAEDISVKHKEKHWDFVLNENIVIINTHETI